MPKHKGDISIGYRAYLETLRLFPTNRAAANAIGCDRKLFWEWGYNGASPNSFYLAKLFYCGADVIYILTGRRQNPNA